MPFPVRIHFDNSVGFAAPHLWAWYEASRMHHDLAPAGHDGFGPFFDLEAVRNFVRFRFKDGPGTGGPWEPEALGRGLWPLAMDQPWGDEAWCRGDRAFVDHVEPRLARGNAAERVGRLAFPDGLYVPGTGGLSGLGAQPLAGGGVLFGLYHPTAARVYVAGDFNDWQCPGAPDPDPARFHELDLHVGWFGAANTWLARVPAAEPGDRYKFYVEGGTPRGADGRARRWALDPHARLLEADFESNNPVVHDPTGFPWTDHGWRTPDVGELILYEMSVYGFTEGDPDIDPGHHGRFAGITERIRSGYFARLGVNALCLMPLAEFPSIQSPGTLGYNPSLFSTVERDFGSPEDLRELVDAAHAAGLAVLLDKVFNHTDNSFNPLWQLVLEHPREDEDPGEGGLYFSGGTPWGNRVATEKADVQNLLIDACKLWLQEYHVDGFRLDATHEHYMDHGFVLRLAEELKGFRPGVLLVAENLPNQPQLNRSGFDGYAQWCNHFHDKVKALLREGAFEGQTAGPDGLGEMFYFSKGLFAGHTNNVVNYCESHDEHSVPHEVGFTPWLDHPVAKERKARLGLFATLVALGQPMLYMGQEFALDRPRNLVTVGWPADLDAHGFFQWASRLIHLRRRHLGLRLRGDDPAGDGRFAWILAPWLGAAQGGGRRVIGWRARPGGGPHEELVVMLNFEGAAAVVDLDLGRPGVWVKLADVDVVHDVAPAGTNGAADPTALHTVDGRYAGFTLPSSSGFVYKWEAPG
ncbi:MAG TPA: alpha-amylase family glycosyl hydrolase [Thermoanaerobaculia bacterium]|nr:alpha-amylase family glycosyl hydrolase [Thermoanaerobaculia bacterium]